MSQRGKRKVPKNDEEHDISKLQETVEAMLKEVREVKVLQRETAQQLEEMKPVIVTAKEEITDLKQAY